MLEIILLMSLAPASIAVGLLLCKSAGLTFLLFHFGVCLLVPVLDALIHRIPFTTFFESCGFRASRKIVVSSFLWGILLFAVVSLLFSLLQGQIWETTSISHAISEWGISRMNTVFLVSMMVIGNAFLEEFFWRGYILNKLSPLCSKRAVVLLSSMFYTSYHAITTGVLFSLPYAIVSTVLVFGAGIVWGTVRVKTGSILFPVITHLFIDQAIMVTYLKYLT